jgi:Tfp pilus assembly protein PilO
MNINFTLIIQALNFFVAYLVLRYFLFKPTVAVIEQERAEENGLKKAIKQEAETNLALIQNNKLEWQIYQKEFLARLPNVSISDLFIYRDLAPAIKAPQADTHELNQLQQEVVQGIIKKVEKLP